MGAGRAVPPCPGCSDPSRWGVGSGGVTERDTHGELIVGAYRVRVSGSGVSAITHDINIFIIDSIIFIDIGV